MTENMINYIGIAILSVAFWFFNIHRPKIKLKNPGNLQIKPVMKGSDKMLQNVLRNVFHDHYILNNVSLDDLIFCQEMNKKQHFHKALKEMKVSYLVLNENMTPILAVDFSDSSEELKFNYLTKAGIPCCIFENTTIEEQFKTELSNARSELLNSHTEATAV